MSLRWGVSLWNAVFGDTALLLRLATLLLLLLLTLRADADAGLPLAPSLACPLG